ncbi:MAG: RNA polymerase sigma factor [Actinomycetota bacterium]
MDVEEGLRFEATYREHGARLWRSVLLYSGDPEVASDAVAEAFAQAIRRGDEVRQPLAWVTRAAFRIAAGELKARRVSDHAIVEASYDMPEPASELIAALEQLSPKQRASAVLHFCDGYTLTEVADMIGSTTSAVSVHLHRARKRLHDLLGEDDG